MKKIKLSDVKNALNRDELRTIKGGSFCFGSDWCPALNRCTTWSHCQVVMW